MPDPVEPRPYLTPDPKEGLEKKTVAPKVFKRLELAADAIAATKRAIAFQGNQVPALAASNMNSYYRLRVMRDDSCWEMTPEARSLGYQNPEALVAAKADLAHGGNCGEHAWVAYHYLREHAAGETIQRSVKSGLDHAFVLIGDLKAETDGEIVCSDPWVNSPMACLWEDHFAFTADRNAIQGGQTSAVADGKSFKAAIAAGLKLSARGLKMVEQKDSDEDTDKATDDWKARHFWNHDDARADKFDYQPEPKTESP
ncbi:MAG: hypothetical protein R2939_13095 [Kofleriaceae bacterium]